MPRTTRQRRPAFVRLSALALVVLTGTGMLWAVNREITTPRTQPLRIGINPWPGYEFAFLAEKLGYFEAEGIEIRLVEFQSLSDSRQAFERGQIDGFFGTLQEFHEVQLRGRRNVSIEWVCDASEGGDVVIGQAYVHSITDLQGQAVAFEPGTVNEYLLNRALTKHGMTWDDIVPIPTVNSRIESLFRNNEVAAVVAYPPVSTELLEECECTLLFSSRDIPGEVIDVAVFDSAVVEHRRTEVIRFFRAFDRAVGFYQDHRSAAVPLLASRTRASISELSRVLNEELRLYRAVDQPMLQSESYLQPLLDRFRRLSNTSISGEQEPEQGNSEAAPLNQGAAI